MFHGSTPMLFSVAIVTLNYFLGANAAFLLPMHSNKWCTVYNVSDHNLYIIVESLILLLYCIAEQFAGGKVWQIWQIASNLSKLSLIIFSLNISPMKPKVSLSKFCSSILIFMKAAFLKVLPCQAFALCSIKVFNIITWSSSLYYRPS